MNCSAFERLGFNSILTVLAQHVGIDRVRAVIGKMRYSTGLVINEFEVNRAIKFANIWCAARCAGF